MTEPTVETDDPWSVTETDLRAGMRGMREAGRPAAVATVAAVEGSAYRRPGAKLLAPADGGNYGAVTAGCLEDAVLDIAREVIDTGRPRLEVFDLVEDDDDTWGLGLGCNGVIDLFVEPLDAGWDRPLAALADGDPVTVLTVVEADAVPVGSRTVVVDGRREAVADRPELPTGAVDATEAAVEAVHGTGRTRLVETDGTRVLVDGLAPTPELLLFGGQNDLPPVARLASQVGFSVHVHSGRGAVDDSSVPAADSVTTGHPTAVADHVTNDEHTYAVVMSHNLLDDRLAVETLLRETAVPYVGLMGPRERFEELRDSLAADGVTLTESELDRVSTPVGLDLGGGEPVEIAFSVVSEALAVSNGRAGGRLRDRKGPIHPRADAGPE
jgi:xanthine dehydrogenase accessory factor